MADVTRVMFCLVAAEDQHICLTQYPHLGLGVCGRCVSGSAQGSLLKQYLPAGVMKVVRSREGFDNLPKAAVGM